MTTMTTITRDQMRPGQIVARVTYYRVRGETWPKDSASKRAGLHKLEELPAVEWQLVHGCWRVRWNPPFSFLGARLGGFCKRLLQDALDFGEPA